MKPLCMLVFPLLLAGCQRAGDMVPVLDLSEGHSRCATERLGDILNRARVVEVIPSQQDCSAREMGEGALGLLSSCPKAVTTVHFRRQANPERTDAIDQPGWISADGTPIRIARTPEGTFAVFLPRALRLPALEHVQCDAFEASVRASLAAHFVYASTSH